MITIPASAPPIDAVHDYIAWENQPSPGNGPWLPARLMKAGFQATRGVQLLVLGFVLAGTLRAATSVSQYGITWTFAADHAVGQYANGDYYVVGPVTITGITPASTRIAGREINGSMLNPVAGEFNKNGFDTTNHGNYDPALNVARPGGNDLSATNPLVLAAGSSLVSCISIAAPDNRPQLSDAAVLTVVSSAPAVGQFRPPYCGTDKSGTWNKASLDYSILRKLAPVPGAAVPATVAAGFVRPWIEVDTQYSGRETHPLNNQPIYGRDMAGALGDALLTLHLDYTDAQKEQLYVNLVQIGLDFYGAAVSGGKWLSNGGHNLGRKAPVLLAGMALNDAAIKAYADYAVHNIFQEDFGTFYINGSNVGLTVNNQYVTQGRPRYTYTTAMIGLPEWGIEGQDWNVASNWSAIYRDVNFMTFFPTALFTQLLVGGKAAWNHAAFFDYTDRAKMIGPGGAYSTFGENMWTAYRSLGAPVWTAPPPVQAAAWVPATGDSITLEASANLSAGVGGEGNWLLTASGGPISVIGTGTGNGGTQHNRTLSRILGAGEIVTLAITNTSNGLEATAGGADMPSFSGLSVVNYSTVSVTMVAPSNAVIQITITDP